MKGLHWDKNGLKHGAWSSEEDELLTSYIRRYNIWNWSQMPKFAGLSRSGKSCRLRWMNYLRPDLKRGNITKEEEQIIVNMYAQMGSRWSKIAARLPGRTDNEIKNYWHTHLKGSNKNAEPRNRNQKKRLSSSADFSAEANIVGSNDPKNTSSPPCEGSNESNIVSYIASEGLPTFPPCGGDPYPDPRYAGMPSAPGCPFFNIASEGSYSKGSKRPRDMMLSNYTPIADSSSPTTTFRVGFDDTKDHWFN